MTEIDEVETDMVFMTTSEKVSDVDNKWEPIIRKGVYLDFCLDALEEGKDLHFSADDDGVLMHVYSDNSENREICMKVDTYDEFAGVLGEFVSEDQIPEIIVAIKAREGLSYPVILSPVAIGQPVSVNPVVTL